MISIDGEYFVSNAYAQGNNMQLASHSLGEIAKFYAIEQECKEKNISTEEIKEHREKKNIPILKELGRWMVEEYKQLRPKTLIAKALPYSIKMWKS